MLTGHVLATPSCEKMFGCSRVFTRWLLQAWWRGIIIWQTLIRWCDSIRQRAVTPDRVCCLFTSFISWLHCPPRSTFNPCHLCTFHHRNSLESAGDVHCLLWVYFLLNYVFVLNILVSEIQSVFSLSHDYMFSGVDFSCVPWMGLMLSTRSISRVYAAWICSWIPKVDVFLSTQIGSSLVYHVWVCCVPKVELLLCTRWVSCPSVSLVSSVVCKCICHCFWLSTSFSPGLIQNFRDV